LSSVTGMDRDLRMAANSRIRCFVWLAAMAAMAPAAAVAATVERGPQGTTVTSRACVVQFSSVDGSIQSISSAARTDIIASSDKGGLWQVKFSDGSMTSASDFAADSKERSFQCSTDPQSSAMTMTYTSKEVQVVILVTPRDDGIDLAGRVQPESKTILEFHLPGRLRFEPRQVNRVICPTTGNDSVGMALKQAFFVRQPQDEPVAWEHRPVGPRNYASLFNGNLVSRPDRDPPVKLRVSQDGQAWFDPELVKKLQDSSATVSRPPAKGQADLVLVDSDNGPWVSASRLEGKGLLWRIGGLVQTAERGIALAAVSSVIRRLSADCPAGRTKLGIIRLSRGPDSGGWTVVRVADWLDRFGQLAAVKAGKVQLVELPRPADVTKALAGSDFIAILNPYGEWIPVAQPGGSKEMVAAIGRYVREGGNWFEVGGYPFHYELLPAEYLQYEATYPDAFADFLHLDSKAGTLAVFGVQPQKHSPWQGATDKAAGISPSSC
jgi:hypothetical protein